MDWFTLCCETMPSARFLEVRSAGIREHGSCKRPYFTFRLRTTRHLDHDGMNGWFKQDETLMCKVVGSRKRERQPEAHTERCKPDAGTYRGGTSRMGKERRRERSV